MDIRLIPGIIIVNLFIKDKEFISNKNFRQLTIRYDSGYLTCSKKLTGSQLSLPQDDVHIYEQKEVTVVCEDQKVEEYYKFYIIHE